MGDASANGGASIAIFDFGRRYATPRVVAQKLFLIAKCRHRELVIQADTTINAELAGADFGCVGLAYTKTCLLFADIGEHVKRLVMMLGFDQPCGRAACTWHRTGRLGLPCRSSEFCPDFCAGARTEDNVCAQQVGLADVSLIVDCSRADLQLCIGASPADTAASIGNPAADAIDFIFGNDELRIKAAGTRQDRLAETQRTSEIIDVVIDMTEQ